MKGIVAVASVVVLGGTGCGGRGATQGAGSGDSGTMDAKTAGDTGSMDGGGGERGVRDGGGGHQSVGSGGLGGATASRGGTDGALLSTGGVATGGIASGGQGGNGANGGVAGGGAGSTGTGGGGAGARGGGAGVAAGAGAGSPGTGGGLAGAGGGVFGSCTDSDTSDPNLGYGLKGQTTGTNGSFTDSCDANGNLVEYSCELVPPTFVYPCPPMLLPATVPAAHAGIELTRLAIATPYCPGYATGRAISTTMNCGGKCRDGTCFRNCPQYGDPVHVVSASSAAVVISNSRAQVLYTCTKAGGRTDHDCTAATLAGLDASISSTSTCTTEVRFGIDDPADGVGEDCSYLCTVDPL